MQFNSMNPELIYDTIHIDTKIVREMYYVIGDKFMKLLYCITDYY